MRWIIDGNNVMGAGGDGWWNDRRAAAVRTADAVARWCRSHEDDVVLVFDEPEDAELDGLAGGNLRIAHATRRGRDAADDRIVEMVAAADAQEVIGEGDRGGDQTVVTSDRGLRSRLPARVRVEGAGAFRGRVGLSRR